MPIVMRRLGLFAFASLLWVCAANAQVPSGNVFFGYSYYNTDLSSVSSIGRASLNGWEASVEGKVIPFLGIVGDFDSHYGSQSFAAACPPGVVPGTCGAFSANVTEDNFLVGPRVSMSVEKFRPFAEALFGGAHVSVNNDVGSDNSFATAIGGGLDYKIIRPIALRVEGDYVHTHLFDMSQNNIRISTGIVLRF
jgi:opacity protein-like surface antigen